MMERASSLEKIIEEHLLPLDSCQEEVAKIKASLSLLKVQVAQSAPQGFTKETMLWIKERQEYREEREEEGIPVDFVLSSMFFLQGVSGEGCHFLNTCRIRVILLGEENCI